MGTGLSDKDLAESFNSGDSFRILISNTQSLLIQINTSTIEDEVEKIMADRIESNLNTLHAIASAHKYSERAVTDYERILRDVQTRIPEKYKTAYLTDDYNLNSD